MVGRFVRDIHPNKGLIPRDILAGSQVAAPQDRKSWGCPEAVNSFLAMHKSCWGIAKIMARRKNICHVVMCKQILNIVVDDWLIYVAPDDDMVTKRKHLRSSFSRSSRKADQGSRSSLTDWRYWRCWATTVLVPLLRGHG